jgi:hypothetical protein
MNSIAGCFTNSYQGPSCINRGATVELAAFVIPHYCEGAARLHLLHRTINSLLVQSDPNWIAIIANDCSPFYRGNDHLMKIRGLAPERIFIIDSMFSCGPGANRNRGARLAGALGAELVLYQDDDDLAHPRRVEVTRSVFRRHSETDFLYSGFIPIDGDDHEIPRSKVRLDMYEVLDALENNPPQGVNVFPQMVGESGFIATLSTVAVRTETAVSFPFPSGRASDDSHTWMRMAATGLRFVYVAEIPTRYRIVQQGLSDLGVNGRDRWFLVEKIQNDLDGFEQGTLILLRRGVLAEEDVPVLTRRFLSRLADCIGRQGETELAARIRAPATIADVVARLGLGRTARRDLAKCSPQTVQPGPRPIAERGILGHRS